MKMSHKQQKYMPVHHQDSEDPDEVDDASFNEKYQKQTLSAVRSSLFHNTTRNWTNLTLFCINLIVLCVSLYLFVTAHIARTKVMLELEWAREENRHFEEHCNEQTGTYSPAWEAVKYKTVEFAGTFDLQSVYKGKPRPELDTAWDALIHGGNFAVDEDVMHRVNKSHNLEYAVQFPDETGGGYVAGLEMFHQMHCVNFLRQYTYQEYYQEEIKAFTDGPELLRLHLDHCIDMLRQVVMCYADTTLLTGVWVRGYPRLSADFNTQHKCRDYEALVDWNQQHADRPESYDHISKPQGAKEMEMPSWVALQGGRSDVTL